MKVEFHKTGARRYAVVVRRDGLPDLKMDPAPGFDPLLPHDLVHLLVEQELGLAKGIFGQLALGGTAGTFRAAPAEKSNARAESRLRRKTAKRGRKLLGDNLDDCARSERATYVCLYDWFAHSPDEALRRRAAEMRPNFDSVFGQLSESERGGFSKEKLAAIRNRMDELAARWSALKPGQSMSLDWPPRAA